MFTQSPKKLDRQKQVAEHTNACLQIDKMHNFGITNGQHTVLQMQRTLGNTTVQRMLQATHGLIQRENVRINGMIKGAVSPIQQPSSMACWATVTTMMSSYRDQTKYAVADIPRVIGRAGGNYANIFNTNTGLTSSDKGPFLTAIGLTAEPAQTLAPEGIASLLNLVGPIWVTTDGGSLNTIHARVVVRIQGDGSADGTLLEIIDPADGQFHTENYGTFSTRFENVANADTANAPNAANPFRAQIVHW